MRHVANQIYQSLLCLVGRHDHDGRYQTSEQMLSPKMSGFEYLREKFHHTPGVSHLYHVDHLHCKYCNDVIFSRVEPACVDCQGRHDGYSPHDYQYRCPACFMKHDRKVYDAETQQLKQRLLDHSQTL